MRGTGAAGVLAVPDGWLRHLISLALASSPWSRHLVLPHPFGFSALLPGSSLGLRGRQAWGRVCGRGMDPSLIRSMPCWMGPASALVTAVSLKPWAALGMRWCSGHAIH